MHHVPHAGAEGDARGCRTVSEVPPGIPGAFQRMLDARKTPFPCGSTPEEVMRWWTGLRFDSETVQTDLIGVPE